jgi:hypothetical protein
MDNLYVIGNSHANFFTLSSPQRKHSWSEPLISEDHNISIRTLSIGLILAYTCISKHYPYIMGALEVAPGVKPRDFVLLAVGEVDCRLHIPKNCKERGIPIEMGTSIVCKRLIKMLLLLKSIGFTPISWGGHPSTTEDYSGDPVHSKDYPNYGKPSKRNLVSSCYNKTLGKFADDNEILFASIFDEIVDENLSPKQGVLMDPCHLSNSMRVWTTAINKIKNCIESKTSII